MNQLLLSVLACPLLLVSVNQIATATDNLAAGDAIGAFYVTKIAGAEGDGVKPGQELCYRCRYGSRPMVIVFAREANAELVELVKQIDVVIENEEDAHLRGLVTFLGEDLAEVKDGASAFAEESGAKHVPVAIAKEIQTGPPNYKLDDSAITIFVAKDSQLVSLHRSKKRRINIPGLMREVKQMLQSDRPKMVRRPIHRN